MPTALCVADPRMENPRDHLSSRVHFFHVHNDILRRSGEASSLLYKGKRVTIFANYTTAVAKKRASFGAVKRQLRDCTGVKFGLIYPAVLRLTLPDSSEHRFEDPALAANFINKNMKVAVVPHVDGLIPREASSPLRPVRPMDLRTQGLHCAKYSQQLLPQHIQYEFDREQSRQEKEQEKRQELQQLMHKDKSEQSAVASPLVKQKLRSQILKRKEQAALERTASNLFGSTTPRGYRELAPDPDMTPKPLMVTPDVHHPLCDQRKDMPLRRTASEPILKVKSKLKKHINSRQNPLQRKTSAPPTVKHRTPDTQDYSPSSSSTPVSGCSSPNDSLLSDSPLTTGLAHETQRLLLQDGTLAHFSLPCSTALPTNSARLPTQGDRESGSHQRVARVLPQVYLPMEGLSAAQLAHQRLQPLLILEPSVLLHTQLVTVRGLSPGPLQYPSSRLECLAPPGPHRPLGRTRSEPPLHSHHHQHQLMQQYHNALLLERLKQNTHLGKLMTKSSEKSRVTQIPSKDMDPAETGPGDGYQRRRQSGTSSTESMWDTESTSSGDYLGDHTMEHTPLMNQSFRWEQPRHLQVLTDRRRQATHLDPLDVPVVLGPAHRPSVAPSPPPPPPLYPLLHGPRTLHSLWPALVRRPPPSYASPLVRDTWGVLYGLVYDSQMLKHQCTCGDNSRHPEHAGRIQSIWSRLQERGLRNQCECIRSRKATLEELQSVHSEKHVLLYGTNPLNRLKLDNRKLS
uniref:histone deacetylase 7-like n=1 Tax=Oncorhynchus gorbuscha TaxID=8017 RepID=UPI001EAF10AE